MPRARASRRAAVAANGGQPEQVTPQVEALDPAVQGLIDVLVRAALDKYLNKNSANKPTASEARKT